VEQFFAGVRKLRRWRPLTARVLKGVQPIAQSPGITYTRTSAYLKWGIGQPGDLPLIAGMSNAKPFRELLRLALS
jgi:hypothetical protein